MFPPTPRCAPQIRVDKPRQRGIRPDFDRQRCASDTDRRPRPRPHAPSSGSSATGLGAAKAAAPQLLRRRTSHLLPAPPFVIIRCISQVSQSKLGDLSVVPQERASIPINHDPVEFVFDRLHYRDGRSASHRATLAEASAAYLARQVAAGPRYISLRRRFAAA